MCSNKKKKKVGREEVTANALSGFYNRLINSVAVIAVSREIFLIETKQLRGRKSRLRIIQINTRFGRFFFF